MLSAGFSFEFENHVEVKLGHGGETIGAKTITHERIEKSGQNKQAGGKLEHGQKKRKENI